MGNNLYRDNAGHEIGVAKPVSLHRRKQHGDPKADQAKRFKQIEQENDRLWELIADLSIDNAILRETAERDF
jgi:putative transposase